METDNYEIANDSFSQPDFSSYNATVESSIGSNSSQFSYDNSSDTQTDSNILNSSISDTPKFTTTNNTTSTPLIKPDPNAVDTYGIFKEDKNSINYQQLIAEYYKGASTKNYSLFTKPLPDCIKNFLLKKYPSTISKSTFMQSMYSKHNTVYNTDFFCKTKGITPMQENELCNFQNFFRNNYSTEVKITKGYSIEIQLYTGNNILGVETHVFDVFQINSQLCIYCTEDYF